MDVRRLVRGTAGWDDIEAVALELADRYDRDRLRVAFLEADNWLSTPLVVDDEWFVKVITPRNSLVHALFTGARNLGAVTAGTETLFEHFGTPLEMAEHELAATRRMRAAGVAAPEPVEAFGVGDVGVLVLEYLPEFETLEGVAPERVRDLAPDVFAALATVHDDGLAHGDLRGENVLLRDGRVYFIDATSVRERAHGAARSYDLACAVGALAPAIGAGAAVEAARPHYGDEDLLAARDFLDFVALRPDHGFDVQRAKGEIERATA